MSTPLFLPCTICREPITGGHYQVTFVMPVPGCGNREASTKRSFVFHTHCFELGKKWLATNRPPAGRVEVIDPDGQETWCDVRDVYGWGWRSVTEDKARTAPWRPSPAASLFQSVLTLWGLRRARERRVQELVVKIGAGDDQRGSKSMQGLVGMGASAVPSLTRIFASKHVEASCDAALALGKIGAPAIAPMIRVVLLSDDRRLSSLAAVLMPPKLYEDICAILRSGEADPDGKVRARAYRLHGLLEGQRAQFPLFFEPPGTGLGDGLGGLGDGLGGLGDGPGDGLP